MIKTRYLWMISLSIALLLPWAAQAEAVIAARVWPAQDYTRITLESSKPIVHKMTLLQNPARVVVDLQQVEINSALKALSDKILASDPYISKVRVAQFNPQTARIVVDLKAEAKPTISTLAPAGSYKHRLVLDIYPAHDPLMRMLAAREDAEKPTEEAPAAPLPPLLEVPSDETGAQAQQTPPVVEEPATSHQPKDENKPQQDNTVTQPTLPTDDARKIVIVLDPGHGGEDPGAIGATGAREKDITLAVSKKLKAKIDAEPNLRAALTRDGDYFIPLHGRVIKARKLQADLFISIHADAFTNPAARGSSVFALSEKGATSASARYLAKKENESDLIGGVSLNVKDPVLARTLLDLSQTATINDSLKLGKAVLGHIGNLNKLHKNHVEQAGFAVLKSPDIPSILVETAFLSNPEEERKLKDEAYQDELAASILAGIKKYFAANPALAKTKVAQE